MAQPRIKRYALVGGSGGDGIRRFHLARLETSSRRLERMEEVAAREFRAASRAEPTNFRSS